MRLTDLTERQLRNTNRVNTGVIKRQRGETEVSKRPTEDLGV